jgi:hypothetical protein
MKLGVRIGRLPGNERRPIRGVSVPVVLSNVNSSISGGSWPNREGDASCGIAILEDAREAIRCYKARRSILLQMRGAIESCSV